MAEYELRADQELPAMTVAWNDADGNPIDFTTGWTFTAKVAASTAKTTVILAKTSGITQATATSPVTIDWTASDLSTITSALGTIGDQGKDCVVHLYARRDSDSKDRVFRPGNPVTIKVYAAPVGP